MTAPHWAQAISEPLLRLATTTVEVVNFFASARNGWNPLSTFAGFMLSVDIHGFAVVIAKLLFSGSQF